MNMVSIAIDDEPLALQLIEDYAHRTELITLKATFTNIHKAIDFLNENKVDVLFLDIQMPDINGIDFYKQYAKDSLVIFTSAYSEFAIEGFDVHAVDYLLKPFSFERFEQALRKLVEAYHLKFGTESKSSQSFIMFKEGHGYVRVPIDTILYLESKDDYVKVILENGKSILTKSTTKAMMEKLPDEYFARIHRSYIVNRTKVSRFDNHKMILKNGTVLPIGALFKFHV